LSELSAKVMSEIAQVVVGKKEIVENIWVALLSEGHVLLEGVPGIAKTLIAKSFAGTLGCQFKRIQFTPDLLPADILGSYVYNPVDGRFTIRRGPIFTNLLLADEVNRAPPKTQSALLECMQEMQVTIEGNTFPLEAPFQVLATQNPIELEGTYPLPEAQIDRFLFKLELGYPTEDEELEMMTAREGLSEPVVKNATGPRSIMQAREAAAQVHIGKEVKEYIKDLVFVTRRDSRLMLGASPRVSLALMKASKTRAAVRGRDYATPDDVKALLHPVLCHRLILKPEAELEGLTAGKVIEEVAQQVKVPT